MTDIIVHHFNWQGKETVDVVQELLGHPLRVEIRLAQDYNHALFRAFHSDAAASALEELYISGGAELLAPVSKLAGLGELAELIEPLKQTNANVVITSPPRIIISTENHSHNPS
jgi:hypothetical protein